MVSGAATVRQDHVAVGKALAPPRNDCKIDLDDGEEEANAAIYTLCVSSLPGWAGLSQDDVEFKKLAGGISNLLVKVAPKSSKLGAVVVKVFGESTDLMVDRKRETQVVCELGAQGYGPKVLALFGNGRIEEFLHCTTLEPRQMLEPSFVARIASKLARFHTASVDLPREPGVFATTRKWLAMARGLQFEDAAKKADYEKIDFGALEAELDATEAACVATGSPLVWGHNDLLSGNIIVMQAPGFDPAAPDFGGELVLIDYEYGDYNYRGFDFGNHFNEYAGFECDYSRYPGREQQALFFSHYFAQEAGAPAALSAGELDELCAEADAFSLASHLFWGVWAVVQACHSDIAFDYLAYAHLRLNEYHRRKQEFMTEATRVFASRN